MGLLSARSELGALVGLGSLGDWTEPDAVMRVTIRGLLLLQQGPQPYMFQLLRRLTVVLYYHYINRTVITMPFAANGPASFSVMLCLISVGTRLLHRHSS